MMAGGVGEKFLEPRFGKNTARSRINLGGRDTRADPRYRSPLSSQNRVD
jgi:hypothetical protein